MASNFAWGIDIGNRALKAVKLVREGDGLRVDDFEVVEHETVLSNAGDNREALVTAALSSVVQMNPLAAYNAMYHDQKFNGTTMVIDLGAENTDLIIADNETIWMRSIPIGGNNFTETLVKAFKLPFNKAEDLKRNAATSKYA